MNEITIEKINVESLIKSLYELYEQGARWLDIKGEKGEQEDKVYFIVKKSYLSEELQKESGPSNNSPKLDKTIIRNLVL